jgi:hypothetical protein
VPRPPLEVADISRAHGPAWNPLSARSRFYSDWVSEPSFAPALAEIEEALVPALIIEELENGSYTVLVPSVPTPFTTALKVFSKWGTGAGEFLRGGATKKRHTNHSAKYLRSVPRRVGAHPPNAMIRSLRLRFSR